MSTLPRNLTLPGLPPVQRPEPSTEPLKDGQRRCEWDGVPYTPKKPWQRFCSDACRFKEYDHLNPRVKKLLSQLAGQAGR